VTGTDQLNLLTPERRDHVLSETTLLERFEAAVTILRREGDLGVVEREELLLAVVAPRVLR
jgi:hypothetical protein